MDLFRRVRWGNVARAAALLTAVALVLAWPRLRSDPPALPPEPALAAPAPAREESPEFGVEPPPEVERRPQRAASRGGGRPEPRRRHRAERRRAASRGRRAPAPHAEGPAPVAPVPIAPAPAPRWTPPPESEFGLGE